MSKKRDKDELIIPTKEEMDKESGEFSTYMDAYRWAAKHITQNGKTIKAESLENEWHKAKSKGTVGLD